MKSAKRQTPNINIGIIGTGYVGLVTGACFAKIGHNVICSDIDEEKINKLKKGGCTIYETGLPQIIKESVERGNLTFTTDNKEMVDKSEFIFICVGTPEHDDGGADLSYIFSSCEDIARNMTENKYIIIKSTVPVTALDSIRKTILNNTDIDFKLLSNPEFLAQGAAVEDFLNPERIIIGADNKEDAQQLAKLYDAINAPIVIQNIPSAMITKYAANAFLAMKISFINAIANVCEKVGADVENVAEGLGYDKRIGKLFLRAGIGYGGSCFPKDTKALYHMAEEVGYEFNLMKDVIEINSNQRQLVVNKLTKQLGNLKGKQVTVLGLAFKPNTDDLREAPSVYLIDDLMKKGCLIKVFDPVIEKLNGFNGLDISKDVYKAAKDADAIVVVTDFPELLDIDYSKIAHLVKNKVIVDGRNILSASDLRTLGFNYSSIGRPNA